MAYNQQNIPAFIGLFLFPIFEESVRGLSLFL